MKEFFSSLFSRFYVFGDKSALLLTAPALIALYFVDEAMTKMLVQWMIFAPIIAGIAIIVSRLVFPQINLTKLVEQTHQGNRASAILAGALLVFVGLLVIGLFSWAKA